MRLGKTAYAVLIPTLAVVSFAVAAILASVSVPNSGHILKPPGMEVYLADKTTPVTEINWGTEITLGSIITTSDVFGQDIVLHNTGDTEWYPQWTKSGLPSGLVLTAQYYNGGWTSWPENHGIGLVGLVKPGEYSLLLRWTLEVTETAAPGPFAFTITLMASDTV